MKKQMMVALALVALALFAGSAWAQIAGTMDIDFQSRVRTDSEGNPEPGVQDTYKMDINVANAFGFAGTITHLPTLLSSTLGRELQSSVLSYALQMRVYNPANPAQSKTVGVLTGGVPINKDGEYQYGNGTMRIAVDAAGKASEFSSQFRGLVKGVPKKDESLLGSAIKKTQTLTKQVKGKTVKIVLTDFDKMAFNGLVLASGPVKKYPETMVNGDMLYDYERSAWYFNNVSLSYSVDGVSKTDKLTGNIKWVESPQRASNGEGAYEFDIRVNEPAVAAGTDEAAVFSNQDDEAAFFETDVSIPSLTGQVKYKDSMSGDTVTRSQVTWALMANQLDTIQQANLAKLIALVCVVPFNAE